MVDGVDLGEEHVVVVEVGARVGEALVWLEEDEVEGDVFGVALVGEERVGVDEDGGACLDVEVQDGSEGSQEVVAEGCGGGRVGYVEDGEGVRRRHEDLLVQATVHESTVDALHRREESRRKV